MTEGRFAKSSPPSSTPLYPSRDDYLRTIRHLVLQTNRLFPPNPATDSLVPISDALSSSNIFTTGDHSSANPPVPASLSYPVPLTLMESLPTSHPRYLCPGASTLNLEAGVADPLVHSPLLAPFHSTGAEWMTSTGDLLTDSLYVYLLRFEILENH